MFYLEKRMPRTGDGLGGNRWIAIYYCPERWPLELLLKHLNMKTYRIIQKKPKEGCKNEPGRNY